MTKKEWLIAIINGAKGTSNGTKNTKYIQYTDGVFRYENLFAVDLSKHTYDFAIYEEPKKMVKVAQYAQLDGYVKTWFVNEIMYKHDEEFVIKNPSTLKYKRLNATEIEVEDY